MPKTKRTPRVETRLTPGAFMQFHQICRLEGKTRTEVARDAILWYLNNHERVRNEERDSAVVAEIKKQGDRMAKLMVKVGTGVYAMEHLFWTRTDHDERKELFKECYVHGTRQMKRKWKDTEDES